MRLGLLKICVLNSFLCAAAGAADVVVTSLTDGKLYRVTPSGQTTLLLQGLAQPWGVAIDSQLNIYFTEPGAAAGDRIRKLSSGGAFSTFYSFDSNVDNPEGLSLGLDGSLFVSGLIDSPSIFVPNNIYRISPNGTASTYATLGNQENLGIVADLLGNVFVGEIGDSGSLFKIDPAGQVTRIATNLGHPAGITMTPDQQRVLVCDSLSARILSVPVDGGTPTVFANIADPVAIAFNGADLYVGQVSGLSRIAPDGTQSVVTTAITDIRGIAVVPEPGTGLLIIATSASLLRRRRRNLNTASTANS
jgi:sugar lactone lactonase YvrE